MPKPPAKKMGLMKLTYMTSDKCRHVERVRDEEEAIKRLSEIPCVVGGTLYVPAKSWDCQSGKPVQVNP